MAGLVWYSQVVAAVAVVAACVENSPLIFSVLLSPWLSGLHTLDTPTGYQAHNIPSLSLAVTKRNLFLGNDTKNFMFKTFLAIHLYWKGQES